MDLGIIGLELAGKTTVFNCLTRGIAHAGSFGGLEPSIGVVKLSDERIDKLSELFKPKKTTYIETRFLDFPGGLTVRDEGPTAAHLAALSQCDALVHVVHAFDKEAGLASGDSVDPHRDIASVGLELAFADAATLERRHGKLETNLRSGKSDDRAAEERELALVTRLKEGLDREEPLRSQEISADEAKILSGYILLTKRPLLLVINVDESDADRVAEIEEEFARYAEAPGVEVAALCAKLEQELGELSEEDAAEFRRDLDVGEDGAARMVAAAQRAMGLLTFFTIGDPEGRAWALAKGSTALDAAGLIHTDISRGFIRAEVIGWEELLECGSLPEARKRGVLRTEGKQYIVQDGDTMLMLFNV